MKTKKFTTIPLDSTGEHEHTTDREGHVIGILEWALDYIVGNIEVE